MALVVNAQLAEPIAMDAERPYADLDIDIVRVQAEDKENQEWATNAGRYLRLLFLFKKAPLGTTTIYEVLPLELKMIIMDLALKHPFTNEAINKEACALALNGPQLRNLQIHPKYAPFLKCDGTLLMAPYGALSEYTANLSPYFQTTVNLLGSPFHSLADKVLREAHGPFLPWRPLRDEVDYYHKINYHAMEAAFRNMAEVCAIAIKQDKHGHLTPKPDNGVTMLFADPEDAQW